MNDLPLVDVKTVLNMLNIRFKEKGDEFRSHCMSGTHEDNTPSWFINKNSGIFGCFACGYRGNLYTLIKELTGQSLKDYLQIGNPDDYMFKAMLTKKKKRIRKIPTKLKITGDILDPHSDKQVMEYLRNRNIDDQFINDFHIKYCNFIVINGTKFCNRILIPIIVDGKILSYDGRTFTDDKPKVLYPKGTSLGTLFNIDNLDFNKELILVEGIMDMVKIYTHITKNVTTCFGINLSNKQIDLLENCQHLLVIPDNDKAGKQFISLLDKHMNYEYKIGFLESKDPGEASVEELKNIIQNAKLSIDYIIEKSGLFQSEEIKWRI